MKSELLIDFPDEMAEALDAARNYGCQQNDESQDKYFSALTVLKRWMGMKNRVSEITRYYCDESGSMDYNDLGDYVLYSDYLAAIDSERKAREKAEDDLASSNEAFRQVMQERCPTDEKHCTCVPFLRQRIKELEAALAVHEQNKPILVSDLHRLREEVKCHVGDKIDLSEKVEKMREALLRINMMPSSGEDIKLAPFIAEEGLKDD